MTKEQFEARSGRILTVGTHSYEAAARGHGPFVTVHVFDHHTDQAQSMPRAGVMMSADDARSFAVAIMRAADRC